MKHKAEKSYIERKLNEYLCPQCKQRHFMHVCTLQSTQTKPQEL